MGIPWCPQHERLGRSRRDAMWAFSLRPLNSTLEKNATCRQRRRRVKFKHEPGMASRFRGRQARQAQSKFVSRVGIKSDQPTAPFSASLVSLAEPWSWLAYGHFYKLSGFFGSQDMLIVDGGAPCSLDHAARSRDTDKSPINADSSSSSVVSSMR